MPVRLHGGGGAPGYGNDGIASMLLYAIGATFFSQRNLRIPIGSGVLDRCPRMQVVFTETRADWVPGTPMLPDGIHRIRASRSRAASPACRPRTCGRSSPRTPRAQPSGSDSVTVPVA